MARARGCRDTPRMRALLLALVLAASPFPAPRVAPVTDRTKCDTGTVLSMDAARAQLRVTTPAGVVTYRAGSDVQVFDRAGKPAGAPSLLAAGQKIRIWYVVEDGAKALEIAVQ
jgi:hypothetical protein